MSVCSRVTQYRPLLGNWEFESSERGKESVNKMILFLVY